MLLSANALPLTVELANVELITFAPKKGSDAAVTKMTFQEINTAIWLVGNVLALLGIIFIKKPFPAVSAV